MILQSIKENWLIIAIFTVAYIFLSHKSKKIEGRYTIAFMHVPGASYFHDKAFKLFKEFIEQEPENNFTLREFAAPRITDMIAITAVARMMLYTEPDVIVTAGAICSECTWSMARRKRFNIPHVTIGVDQLKERGMIESEEHPGGNITGALGYDQSAVSEADLILALKPNVKKVLVPYYSDFAPKDSSQARAQDLKQHLATYGIQTTLLPIENMSQVFERVKMMLYGHDFFLYFAGDALMGSAPCLIRLANRFSIPLLAGGMAGETEAAFSYGDDEYGKTKAAYNQVKQILLERKKPGDIPIVKIFGDHKLIINVPAARRQGYADINVQEILERLKAPQFEQIRDRIEVIE